VFGGRAPFVAGGVISVLAAVVCGLVLRRSGAEVAPDLKLA